VLAVESANTVDDSYVVVQPKDFAHYLFLLFVVYSGSQCHRLKMAKVEKTRNHFYCCIRLLIGDHLGFVKLISRDICKLMAT